MNFSQSLFKALPLRPIKKLGRVISSFWPFPVRVKLNTGREMYVDLRSAVGRGIFATGQFDKEVFAPLAEVLKPGDTFVDVGANVGYYSMRVLDLLGETGEIHAFEIDPRPIKCLKRTISRFKLESIHLHVLAVGEAEGSMSFDMRYDCGHSGLSLEKTGMDVQVRRIDDVINVAEDSRIKAIKIDVEGAELLVLRGSKELLRRERPFLVVECDDDLQEPFGYDTRDVITFLEKLDYRVSFLPNASSPTIVAKPV